jgi:hypothetical protein
MEEGRGSGIRATKHQKALKRDAILISGGFNAWSSRYDAFFEDAEGDGYHGEFDEARRAESKNLQY